MSLEVMRIILDSCYIDTGFESNLYNFESMS